MPEFTAFQFSAKLSGIPHSRRGCFASNSNRGAPEAGDWDRVRGHLEQHFALAMPVDAELVRHLVGVQLQLGARCDALLSLSWLLEHEHDGQGAAWFQTGLIYAELGDVGAAQTAFTQAQAYSKMAERAGQALILLLGSESFPSMNDAFVP